MNKYQRIQKDEIDEQASNDTEQKTVAQRDIKRVYSIDERRINSRCVWLSRLY